MNYDKELIVVNEENGVFRYDGDCFNINNEIIELLKRKASEAPLKRSRILLHKDENSNAQQMLICISKDSLIPLHHHQKAKETITVIQGQLEYIYKSKGKEIKMFLCSSKVNNMVCTKENIPHKLKALSDFAIFVECSDGPFSGKMSLLNDEKC